MELEFLGGPGSGREMGDEVMMSQEDQELVDFLDSISVPDDKDKDWKDRPELGLDPDDHLDKDEDPDEEDEGIIE